ncbi:hypothetical protein Namu_0205 [Nakamurella multipartita DSM 44233]|jgi:hypothetical protein|uniref:N-acetyltransferase domain-containing protein n=2 Tax=Nakamurella TaxID=53460 RepID=C8XJV5_NAKMY|nr:hypothetical protein Namu_0205 [Nakamurella multipartita DSM 44233]
MRQGGVLGHYLDPASGARFVYARPEDQPELWNAYLDGAAENYRRFGVEHVLEYDDIRTGAGTTLFVAVLDRSGQVVAGVRAQGPYTDVDDAHALMEWAGRPGTAALREGISARIDEGLLELKAGWVSADSPDRHALTPALARTVFHIFRLIGVRYALCTVADHAVRRWQSSGAQIGQDVAPVAYPDPRYRTVPIWWDRETMLAASDASHLLLLAHEQEMFELSLNPDVRPGTPAAA